MKIAWFLSGQLHVDRGITSSILASNRLRALCLVPELQKAGHEVTVIQLDQVDVLHSLPEIDVAIIGKVFRDHTLLYSALRRSGIKIIADVCDNPFEMRHLRAGYESLLHWADSVVASTKNLYTTLSHYTNKVDAVVADCVEGARREVRVPDGKSRLQLLWYGQPANIDGLIEWLPKLHEYHRAKLTIKIVTRLDPEVIAVVDKMAAKYSGLKFVAEAWHSGAMESALLACDVVVVPSVLSEEKLAKTANRVQTALWAGCPVIASPVPSYLEYQQFCYLGNDPCSALDALLDNPQSNQYKVESAQNYIAQKYLPYQLASKWNELIHNSVAERRSSGLWMKPVGLNAEMHIMIVWHNATQHVGEIITDISEQGLVLKKVWKIAWSEDKFAENLSRLYRKNSLPGARKLRQLGVGPFTLILLEDIVPTYGYRSKDSGIVKVNIKWFDLTTKYRSLVGSADLVHASESVADTCRYLALLLGESLESVLKSIPEKMPEMPIDLSNNLVGADGWRDFRQLFSAMNKCVKYVVMRGYDELPDNYPSRESEEIEILVEDFDEAVLCANAKAVSKAPWRSHTEVIIGGESVHVAFRHVGDGCYDQRWQQEILAQRVWCQNGFFCPDPVNYFYAMVYHAVANKRTIEAEYANSLRRIGKQLGIVLDKYSAVDRASLKLVVEKLMGKRGYRFVRPSDKSLAFLVEESGVVDSDSVSSSNGPVVKNDRVKASIVPVGKKIKPNVSEPFRLREAIAGAIIAAQVTHPIYHEQNADWETKVWKAYIKELNMWVAVKRVHPFTEEAVDAISREHEFLMACDHPGIVKHIAHIKLEDDYLLVTKWINGYSLLGADQQFMTDLQNERSRASFFKELAAVVSYLQSRGISHRDIWAKNVVVSQGHPVLLSFGRAIWRDKPGPSPSSSDVCQSNDMLAVDQLQTAFCSVAA